MHNTLSQPPQSRDRKIISRLCGYSSFTLLLWIPFYLLIFYINRIIQYVLFCIFHSASWMILEFSQVVDYICGVHCFLLLNIILLDNYGSVQFSRSVLSVSFHPMDCSMPGLPVHFLFPELAQTHVWWVGNAIQPCHPLLSPSPPAFNLSQHQGLFQWVNSLHQVTKVLECQHQPFQWIDFIDRPQYVVDGY